MNRNNILLVLAIILMLITAMQTNAQRRNKAPENRFGVRAGFNMSDLTSATGIDVFNGLALYNKNLEHVGFNDTKPFKYGFNVGFTSQIQLYDAWYLQPSLIITSKGYKINSQNLGYEAQNVEINTNAFYVQLPIDVVWKYEITDDFRFLAALGGFLGYGIAGNTYFEDHYGEKNQPRTDHEQTWKPSKANGYIGYDRTVHGLYYKDIDETFESEGTNRFDAGLEIGIGFELKSFQLMLTYQYSLTPFYDYDYDFSQRYKTANIPNTTNSFEYLRIETPKSPSYQVFSLTLSYYLDFFSNKIKY
jgi:hypothetical protein